MMVYTLVCDEYGFRMIFLKNIIFLYLIHFIVWMIM